MAARTLEDSGSDRSKINLRKIGDAGAPRTDVNALPVLLITMPVVRCISHMSLNSSTRAVWRPVDAISGVVAQF